ncbi:hypothetical protein [Mycobacterium leprae]|uniref:hypothetical protein n=1 Tax=Mycobacterium leprae TaxID=1769 RepID=UPI00059BF684|nr:hypothetical protein [Mycobacterium leprae]OAR20266.1 hypothetical protein A8144_11675 [Mycobacterium leprae 3125609]OAX70594.1 hypothetical protein A3216_11135 [Mycobacterium leprae 7935681]
MSTATLDRLHYLAHAAPASRLKLLWPAWEATGCICGVIESCCRLWVLLLSPPLASVYVGSISMIYLTEAAHAEFADSINHGQPDPAHPLRADLQQQP